MVKSTDIKIGHIYYVDYEPVRDGEFNGKHLSVVLKRNNDKYTFVVMPLTSSTNGDRVNKIKIGKMAGLPPSTRNKDTFAVFDQVRTVNANRFMAVKDAGNRIDVAMEGDVWLNLFELAVRDIVFNVPQDEKIAMLKKAYDRERFNKAKDLAYTVIKLRNSGAAADEKITALKDEIRDTLKDASYVLDAKQAANGIQKIFDEAVNR
jgi:mRNA-degrading endonuclease toxin of MazEF toxin-antitoxin module